MSSSRLPAGRPQRMIETERFSSSFSRYGWWFASLRESDISKHRHRMLEGLCEAAHEFAAASKWRAIGRVPEARWRSLIKADMRGSFLELAISAQSRWPGDFCREIRRAQKITSGGYTRSRPRFECDRGHSICSNTRPLALIAKDFFTSRSDHFDPTDPHPS